MIRLGVRHYKVAVNGVTSFYLHVRRESCTVSVWSPDLCEFIQGVKTRQQTVELVRKMRTKGLKIERLSDY